MKAAQFGRIINISSGAGLGISLTGIQAYAAAKAAQIGLTRQLAHELGQYGITVNNIALLASCARTRLPNSSGNRTAKRGNALCSRILLCAAWGRQPTSLTQLRSLRLISRAGLQGKCSASQVDANKRVCLTSTAKQNQSSGSAQGQNRINRRDRRGAEERRVKNSICFYSAALIHLGVPLRLILFYSVDADYVQPVHSVQVGGAETDGRYPRTTRRTPSTRRVTLKLISNPTSQLECLR